MQSGQSQSPAKCRKAPWAFLLFFNLDFFLAIKTALHTTSATKKKKEKKKNAQERIVFHATDLGSSHTDGLLVSVK